MNYYGFSKEDAVKAVVFYREYYAERGIFENKLYPGVPELLAKPVSYTHLIHAVK